MQLKKLYKHKNCTDAAIYVLNIYSYPERFSLRVKWFNIVNPKNIFDMGVRDDIIIKLKDLHNWEEIT
jgi:hypothetical protein